MGENQRVIFVKNLQRFMKMRGVDQSDIVIALGVSASTVSDWATGKKYPRVDSMQRLADYLGVYLSDLTSSADYGSTAPDDSPLPEIGSIDYALSGEIRYLSEAEKEDVLEYVRFKRAQKARKDNT